MCRVQVERKDNWRVLYADVHDVNIEVHGNITVLNISYENNNGDFCTVTYNMDNLLRFTKEPWREKGEGGNNAQNNVT